MTDVVIDSTDLNYKITTHGAALFNAQCIVCHGADGKASLSGAKDLTLSTKSEAEMIEIIKTGKNTMPKMADIYNDTELAALANYVNSLR